MRLMTTLHTVERLREIFGDRLAISEPLSRHTTARVGGPAELFLTAASAEELRLAVEVAYAAGLPYFILGGGSNILVADSGISGLVILNRARKVSFRHSGAGVVCVAEAGVNLLALARQCIGPRPGRAGVGYRCAGHGRRGGGRQCRSARRRHRREPSWPRLSSNWATACASVHRAEMAYGYRTSVLKRDTAPGRARRVVLSAELRLTPEPVDVLTARADGFTAHRKERQPGGASLGSMFKNPGELLRRPLDRHRRAERVRASATPSSLPVHANFFHQRGRGATADDFRSLICRSVEQRARAVRH